MGALSSKIRGVDFLPSLPHAVVKLLDASLDEAASMSGIAEIAANDPGLTSQILRLANSPLFGVSRKVASLSQAVVNLGLQSVRSIAVSLSVYESFTDLSKVPNFSLAGFWWHSLCTAICGKGLAIRVGYPCPEEAFIAGILHDIGQLFLLKINASAWETIVQVASSGNTVVEAEKKVWGTDHATAGAELLERWRLPPLVCDAVRYHHYRGIEIREAMPLVRIVSLADRLSHHFQIPDSRDAAELKDLLDMLLGLPPGVVEDMRDSIFLEVEEASRIYGIEISPDTTDIPGRCPVDEGDGLAHLKNKVFDQALLIGALQDLVAAKTERELFEALLRSLVVLFDLDRVLMLRKTGRNVLVGVLAMGSKQDEIASRIRIPCGPGTIWNAAFEENTPVHFDRFFAFKTPPVIDEQIANYLGSSFLVVPMSVNGEYFGAVVVAISADEWKALDRQSEVLMLLARQMASALRGHKYRTLLKREKVLNAATLEAAPVAIMLSDPLGRAGYCNPRGKRLLGFEESRGEVVNIWDHLSFNTALRDDVLRRIENREIFEVQGYEWTDPKGRPRWLNIRAVPLRMGGKLKVVLAVEDVTAAKLLEREREDRAKWLEGELNKRTEQLQKAQEKILKAERSVAASDMARKVAHEVANPLGIIKNFLKILKLEGEESGKNTDVVEAIDREIDRIARIIQRLRDFSGYSSGDPERAGGYVQKALADISALMERHLSSKGIELEIHVEHDLPMLKLSEDGIKQVLINLIKNAEEALMEKGRIIVRAFKDPKKPDEVVIEVQDTGPGVPEEIREKIFEPFVTSKGEGNTGLGLSVCLGLVRAAGGTIRLKEQEGPGACFEIRLPRAIDFPSD